MYLILAFAIVVILYACRGLALSSLVSDYCHVNGKALEPGSQVRDEFLGTYKVLRSYHNDVALLLAGQYASASLG